MRKVRWYLYPLMILFMLSSCTNLDEVNGRVNDHEKRIKALEQLVKQGNDNTAALQALLVKVGQQNTISSYEPLKDGSGYVLTMSDGSKITLKNGKDALVPAIGVKEDNGVFYWTLNDNYLLDAAGNRVIAKGSDGKAGVTPKLRINRKKQWEVSYDNGANWTPVLDEEGKPILAVGSSDNTNLSIESDDTYVIIVYNGKTYKIPHSGMAKPTSITLTPKEMVLEVGATMSFTLKFEPANTTNKEVTWTSDNEKIVTVKDGVVTAHAVGTAIISVVSKADVKVRATATVRVRGAAQKLALEYVTEYNVNPEGNGFVKTHLGKSSGYYTWDEAMERFSREKNFKVNNVGYHLPSYEEWCSIIPKEYVYLGMPNSDRLDSKETVSIGGQIQELTCDYRFLGQGIAYAIRFKDSNSQKSAWRYQFKDNPAGAGEKMLEITVRSLVGVKTPIKLDDISKESYWQNNNSNDIVRRFPAAGYLNRVIDSYLFYNEYGHYWSSSEEGNLAKFMIFSDFFSYSDYAHIKSFCITVRLFTNN
ncbi:PL29 family lyase N-terminal domain-containing protein [Porphyromonas levii]|uniref:PL29 family lyase N-terminal domain-containing protein n=1 Tax=Porphyromonas levii TaxID=28114 RepID=UPI001461343D|nr:PL29 family lyase N-terminal domain-containing protein [Porphyromonas levii]